MILQSRVSLDLYARTGSTILTLSRYGIEVLNDQTFTHRTFFIGGDTYYTYDGHIETSGTAGRVALKINKSTTLK